MQKSSAHLEELLAFIREHRSNEIHFEKVLARLSNEYNDEAKNGNSQYSQQLVEIKEKQAEEYKTNKEKTGNAWPEYEKFIAGFERAVTGALNNSN